MLFVPVHDSNKICSCRPKEVPAVAQVEDLKYPGAAGQMHTRMYNPNPGHPSPQPALIYIHGGGWCFDDIECHDSICRDLAKQSGVVVFSLDYRLAPEHPFPAGLEDCYAATQWLHTNANKLNIDPARIAASGDSAGGNLTAAISLLTHERRGAPIAFQLLLYPSLDIQAQTESRKLLAHGYGLDEEFMLWVVASYTAGHDKADPLLSPLMAPDVNFMPPTMILTAEYDPLRDDGKMFADKLLQQGVACTYRCYEGMIHGFLNHMYMAKLDVGEEAMADCAKSLREALHVSTP